MKKQGAKPLRPVHPAGEVGHLDEKLTEITTTTAQRLKKWRTPLIALAAAVIAIQVGFFVVGEINEWKQLRLNQEIFELVQGPESRKEGYVLDQARLEKLLGEVRGDVMEGYVYKTVVHFYLERAASLKDEATGRGSPITDPANITAAPDPASAQRALEALDRASALAQEAASRLPGDKDIQVWAGVVKAKAADEKDAPWSKTKRRYAPPVPGSATAAPAPAPAAAVPDPAPARSPSSPPAEETGAVPTPPGGEAPAPPDGKAPEKGSG